MTLAKDGKNLFALTTENKKGSVHFLDVRTLETGFSMPLKDEVRWFIPEENGLLGVRLANETAAILSLSNPALGIKIEPFVAKLGGLSVQPLMLAEAIDLEVKSGFRITQKGWLEQLEFPGDKVKARWKLPVTVYDMAYDAKAGRLYLAVIDPAAILQRAKGFGDIWAIDVKDLGK